MSLTRTQIIIIAVAGTIILFVVLLFLGVIPGLRQDGSGGFTIGPSQSTINLEFWGVFDDENIIQLITNEYSKNNKDIRINYRHFNDAEIYEKSLINALAAARGPDIFMFHNSWLAKHSDKIVPVPEKFFSFAKLRELFPTVIEQDFVVQEIKEDSSIIRKIYALPLFVDTLALFYNQDIFDARAIALSPKTWQEFQSLIPQLRQLNQFNQIVKPAAAIGGSEKSIDSASDLLALLMMQFGSSMTDSYGRISFGDKGLQALNFYLQFANPASSYYTWNDNLSYSLNSFARQETAIIFNYASQIPLIKDKNPYLNFRVSPMLQIDPAQPINYANYWGLAVSNQSKERDWAWHFIISATTNPQIAEIYLKNAQKPPVLRTLIEEYKDDSDLGVFVKQSLSSRSWLRPDNLAIKNIFSEMIESVLSGRLLARTALTQAENQINELKK